MGTETLSFLLLEPEKNAFKDGNPTSKIMTKRELFFGAISLGILTDVWIYFFFFLFAILQWVLLGIMFHRIFKCTGCPIPQNISENYQRNCFKKQLPFCHDFKSRVTIFKCIFLRLQESKWQSFSAHHKENYMQIPKLTLLLFLVPFLWELWPFKHGPAFFGTPCRMHLFLDILPR